MARRGNFDRFLERLPAEITRDVSRALFAGGEMIAVEAQNSITAGSSSGTRGGKHQHTPSAPGEAPNNFTGHLAGNIEVTQPDRLKVEVTSHAEYSAALEFGTSKMEARPFMAPAANAKRREVQKLVSQAVSRAIRRTGGRT